MESLLNFLMFALPGGFIGSVFTWLVGRREHNNDMLSKLQASINLLSEENRKILAENVQLRRENADLKANQEEMIQKLSRLTKEVERLRKVINKQTGNDEKPNQRDNPHADNGRGAYPRGVCGREAHTEPRVTGSAVDNRLRIPRHTGDRSLRDSDGDNLRPEGTTDDLYRHGGGDSGGVGDAGCADTEPP